MEGIIFFKENIIRNQGEYLKLMKMDNDKLSQENINLIVSDRKLEILGLKNLKDLDNEDVDLGYIKSVLEDLSIINSGKFDKINWYEFMTKEFLSHLKKWKIEWQFENTVNLNDFLNYLLINSNLQE